MRLIESFTSFSLYEGSYRIVFLEQLEKHQCQKSNIDSNGAFAAGFIKKVKQDPLILEAVDADVLPTVKSLIKQGC